MTKYISAFRIQFIDVYLLLLLLLLLSRLFRVTKPCINKHDIFTYQSAIIYTDLCSFSHSVTLEDL
jgi:hypothetical protein